MLLDTDVVSANDADTKVWRLSNSAWALLVVAVILAGVFSFEGLKYMADVWFSQEEYSYAYFIPAISLFLIWQKRDVLERLRFDGSWLGTAVVLLGLGLSLLGDLSTIYVVMQYSFLIVVAGLALTLMGWRAFKAILVPLLLLAFMVPLPNFLYQGLSAESQLISSQIGVGIIRLFGISVLLEGNVIDLGSYKLQVAEACNGLRYLFPLMALGFIAAYLFKAPLWKRAVVFLSTIPITILMNSIRIGIIGLLVEHWGVSMAEGFLHDFEGWAIFMTCIGVLLGEMWLLSQIGPRKLALRDLFTLDLPHSSNASTPVRDRAVSKPFQTAVIALAVAIVAFALLPPRVEALLQRRDFSQFPMSFDRWSGRPERMEAVYLNVLKLDDYMLADFVNGNGRVVNFYVAYYASQRKGESAHSPRSCIPGGGWQITSLDQQKVDGATIGGQPLVVNRVVIQKGDNRQLVYYWFQQRGRIITNEYMAKWYLLWDSLTRNRTDGALVRLVTDINSGRDAEADMQLNAFARSVGPRLAGYIPD